MAILDATLAAIVARVEGEARAAGLARVRGGIARGVAWAELSGRGSDGSWLEMRLHHRPTEQRLQAGLLRYLPLSRGGRTEILGEHAVSYTTDPAEVADGAVALALAWIGAIEKETARA